MLINETLEHFSLVIYRIQSYLDSMELDFVNEKSPKYLCSQNLGLTITVGSQ